MGERGRFSSGLARLLQTERRANGYQDELDDLKFMLGRQFFALRPRDSSASFSDSAYRVFSQFGEDGILDRILTRLRMPVPRSFVEVGVDDYREANTRFLCESGGWRGLIVDAGDRHIAFAKRRMLSVHRQLVAKQAFLDVKNADAVLVDAGFGGEVGVLSIDIDGVDYWVAQSMKSISPVVVIVEHNPYFGAASAVTVPYEDGFVRRQKHPSGVYYGASIQAWCDLWRERGYELVAVSPEGLNLFFVRTDHCEDSWRQSAADAYRRPSFSPYSADGVPVAMLDPRDALRPLGQMSLHDVRQNTLITVGDLP